MEVDARDMLAICEAIYFARLNYKENSDMADLYWRIQDIISPCEPDDIDDYDSEDEIAYY